MKLAGVLSVLALSVSLVTPTVVKAQPVAGVAMFQDQRREFKDADEKAWHDYLKQKNRKDHDWAKASKREQKDYWKWRDAHPDTH